MKKFSFCAMLIALAVAGISLTGCTAATPAYSASERFDQIGRNLNFQAEVSNDSFDHLFFLRPSDQLTIWDVYHRN